MGFNSVIEIPRDELKFKLLCHKYLSNLCIKSGASINCSKIAADNFLFLFLRKYPVEIFLALRTAE